MKVLICIIYSTEGGGGGSVLLKYCKCVSDCYKIDMFYGVEAHGMKCIKFPIITYI